MYCHRKGWGLRRVRLLASAFSTRRERAGADHGSMDMLSV